MLLLQKGGAFLSGLSGVEEIAEVERQHFRKPLDYSYMPYYAGQQRQILEGGSGEGPSSEENSKIQKGTHVRLINRLQWGGLAGMDES